MEYVPIIVQIAILLMSVVVHEVSHGFTALMLGDATAKYQRRLTLNPINHLDPIGSVLVPLLLIFTTQGSFVFGWAKPVPYNPYNLRNQKFGPALVAAAGPLSNIFIAGFFGLLFRVIQILSFGIDPLYLQNLSQILFFIVFINVLLAIFNLVPIPPLDGSKVLFSMLPYHLKYIEDFLQQYGFILLIIFILFLFDIIRPLVHFLVNIFIGSQVF